MRDYKTPAHQRAASTARYKRLKQEQGDDFLKKNREYKKTWREKNGRQEYDRCAKHKNLKGALCLRARARGRKAGMAATITATDLSWPEFCPVLGLKLDYTTPRGTRAPNFANAPSLDRWDNTKGYVPGNVFVISLRANSLKSNALAGELEAVADYARHGPVY